MRLVHMLGRSVFLPDFLFAQSGDSLVFFRPSFFSPNNIAFVDGSAVGCEFTADIAKPNSNDAVRVVVEVEPQQLQKAFADGSQVYRCKIRGPTNLLDRAGGPAQIVNGDFLLELNHFTSAAAAEAIRRERSLRCSTWTIQGLHEATNVAHAYFTTLSTVSTEEDLRRIAMASDAEIQFLTTRASGIEEVVKLQVYRGSTADRTECVALWVPLSLISPPDILFHVPADQIGYYEVVAPEIIRVSLRPGESLTFNDGYVVSNNPAVFRFDYVIATNAETATGIAAPFEEAERHQIGHVQLMPFGDTIFWFWWRNQNKDLFNGRTPTWRELAKP